MHRTRPVWVGVGIQRGSRSGLPPWWWRWCSWCGGDLCRNGGVSSRCRWGTTSDRQRWSGIPRRSGRVRGRSFASPDGDTKCRCTDPMPAGCCAICRVRPYRCRPGVSCCRATRCDASRCDMLPGGSRMSISERNGRAGRRSRGQRTGCAVLSPAEQRIFPRMMRHSRSGC